MAFIEISMVVYIICTCVHTCSNEPSQVKTNEMTLVHNKDSDQPVHHLPKVSSCGQRRLIRLGGQVILLGLSCCSSYQIFLFLGFCPPVPDMGEFLHPSCLPSCVRLFLSPNRKCTRRNI